MPTKPAAAGGASLVFEPAVHSTAPHTVYDADLFAYPGDWFAGVPRSLDELPGVTLERAQAASENPEVPLRLVKADAPKEA